MKDALETRMRNAPRSPGVYLMKDGAGKILYVGKARDLRGRIRSYLSGSDTRAMVPFLVSRTDDVEFVVTSTEKEALILENNLIKEYRPRYNVDFRDDKAYYSIRIDPRESFPRFQLVRRPKKDGARYFGPHPSSAAAKETLNFLQGVFPLRTCPDRELYRRSRPCLEYEIKRCLAPCAGRIGEAEYARLANDAVSFLDGKEGALLAELRARMEAASQELRFEEAAVLRDRIRAIEETLTRQMVVSQRDKDRDVFGLYRQGDRILTALHLVRAGKMVGQKLFPLIELPAESAEILSGIVKRYYDESIFIPDEILIPEPLEDQTVLAEWLAEKKGRTVSLVVPKRGEALALVQGAALNARVAFSSAVLAAADSEAALGLLQEKLRLRKVPRLIECFDISNIGGRYAVGAMVTFQDGLPLKRRYRRFRVRSGEGGGDYAMLYEVLRRRYENGSELPDLLIVDGGKGQLNVALAVLKDLAIEGVEVVGLAKGGGGAPRAGGAVREAIQDHLYLPGRREPLYMGRWPACLSLLQRIRDEAHRFAVSYFRKVKEREDLGSLIDLIDGIGPDRRRALLSFFGDVERIKGASLGELKGVPGIGDDLARRIYEFFKGRGHGAGGEGEGGASGGQRKNP